jgi:hypothetical protein
MRIARIAAVVALACCSNYAGAADIFVYFGSHRSGPVIGFSLSHFDTDTGVLTKPQFLIESPASTFLVIPANGRLTATGEPVAVPYPFYRRFLPVR